MGAVGEVGVGQHLIRSFTLLAGDKGGRGPTLFHTLCWGGVQCLVSTPPGMKLLGVACVPKSTEAA